MTTAAGQNSSKQKRLSLRIIDVPHEYRGVIDVSDDIDERLIEFDVKGVAVHRRSFQCTEGSHRKALHDRTVFVEFDFVLLFDLLDVDVFTIHSFVIEGVLKGIDLPIEDILES